MNKKQIEVAADVVFILLIGFPMLWLIDDLVGWLSHALGIAN